MFKIIQIVLMMTKIRTATQILIKTLKNLSKVKKVLIIILIKNKLTVNNYCNRIQKKKYLP